MDEKELNKKLRSDVKPGTESLAINEAQTQADQLLTEQRMNLESERQMAQSSSVRDIELRGAIELGAMNQPQVQQVALPPQAAGLRPETQQLLANYGVNPTITESSRRSSNSSQSRTSNTTSKVDPNGGTRVTNTTNITNITNNDNRTETDIDIDQPVQSTQPTVMPAVSQKSDTSKFKIFMSNLFAKRDQEARIQEREFRKRDWSIKRMTDKVIQRMDKISTSFAKRMNPENVGKTIGSQLKVILTALGFAVLPKIFPSIKDALSTVASVISDGFNYIKGVFNNTEGGFFTKLGAVFTSTIGRIANYISETLGELIIGSDDYRKGSGITGAIADKISEIIGGRDPETGKITPLMDQIKGIAGEIRDNLKSLLTEMAQDRAKAIKQVAKDGWDDLSLTNPSTWIKALSGLLSAALLGTEGLASHTQSKINDKSDKQLQKGIDSDDVDSGLFGTQAPTTITGASKMFKNLGEASVDSKWTNANTMNRGFQLLNEFSRSPESSGKDISINERDLRNVIKRVSPDPQKSLDKINEVIDNSDIFPYIERHEGNTHSKIPYNEPSGNIYIPNNYRINKEWIPTLIGVIKGIDGVSFDKNKIPENNRIVNDLLSNRKRLTDDTIKLDKRIQEEQIGKTAYKDNLTLVNNSLYNSMNKLLSFNGRLYTPEYKSYTQSTSSIGNLPEYVKKSEEHELRMNEIKVFSGPVTQKAINHIKGNDSEDEQNSSDSPGVKVTSPNPPSKVTKKESIKRNNPGNIRPSNGNGFVTYDTLSDGYAAMFNKITRWYEKAPTTERSLQLKTEDGRPLAGNPADSINKFIRIWAPAQDKNNEEAYVKALEKYTGIDRDSKFDINDKNTMMSIAEAMTMVEHLGGSAPNTDMKMAMSEGWDKKDKRVIPVESNGSGILDNSTIGDGGSSNSVYDVDINSSIDNEKGFQSVLSSVGSGISYIGDAFAGALDNLLKISSENEDESQSSIRVNSIPEISSKMATAEMDDSVSVSSSSSVPTFLDGGISQQAKSIQEYIENKEDELVKDEKLPSEVTPIIVGGDTHVGGSSTVTNNTTVVNVNDSFESFIDTKSRSNRRN